VKAEGLWKLLVNESSKERYAGPRKGPEIEKQEKFAKDNKNVRLIKRRLGNS